MVVTTVVAAVVSAVAAVYVAANANASVGIAGATATCVNGDVDDGGAGSTIAATVAEDVTDVPA